jgi:hypothetical protein
MIYIFLKRMAQFNGKNNALIELKRLKLVKSRTIGETHLEYIYGRDRFGADDQSFNNLYGRVAAGDFGARSGTRLDVV